MQISTNLIKGTKGKCIPIGLAIEFLDWRVPNYFCNIINLAGFGYETLTRVSWNPSSRCRVRVQVAVCGHKGVDALILLNH